MKRIISILIMLTLLASTLALVSCATNQNEGNEGNEGTSSTADTTIKDENKDDPDALPKMDFKGEVIKFAVSPVDEGAKTSLAYLSCDADENDGSVIASSVYERNRMVEELLSVKIQVVYTDKTDDFKSTVRNSVNSGKNEYDVVFVNRNGMTLAEAGCIENIRLLDECYIDTNAEWWDSDYINAMHYADEVFWLAGPLSLTYASGLSCFFVNLDMYNAKLKDTYGDIYDLVRAGKWTFDNMCSMSAAVYDPVNPNAAYPSDEDVMGLRVTTSMSEALAVGMGVRLSSKNADGTGVDLLVTRMSSDLVNPMNEIAKKVAESDKDGIIRAKTAYTVDQFVAEKQLFNVGTFVDATELIDKANFEIAVIPTPMYNEEQKEYRTAVSGNAQVIGIVDGCLNTAAVSATLEYMARLGNTMVKDVLYRQILGQKYAENENVMEMLDTLNDSRYVDFVMCYQVRILSMTFLSLCTINDDIGRYIFSRKALFNTDYTKFLNDYVPKIGNTTVE